MMKFIIKIYNDNSFIAGEIKRETNLGDGRQREFYEVKIIKSNSPPLRYGDFIILFNNVGKTLIYEDEKTFRNELAYLIL